MRLDGGNGCVTPTGLKCPAEVYTPSRRPYRGLPDLDYPLHDRDVLVTACGRICIYRKKINVSTVLAGQRLGIKEVDEGIWLVSFIDYDLGYTDLEQKTLQPVDDPLGLGCHPCLRYVLSPMCPGRTLPRPPRSQAHGALHKGCWASVRGAVETKK
jgi:hypothetical protein